ncbi:hypothetical protein ACH3XW_41045 [Acanthocheilonema viteae]
MQITTIRCYQSTKHHSAGGSGTLNIYTISRNSQIPILLEECQIDQRLSLILRRIRFAAVLNDQTFR